jgi:hypothetical protein
VHPPTSQKTPSLLARVLGCRAKKDETPHHQHGQPNAESRGEQAEEQQPYARAYHHPIGHQRDGGPHRVQAGVGEQRVQSHLDAHAQDAQRIEQGRRDAHVEDRGLRKAPDVLLFVLGQSSVVLLPTPSVELRLPPGYTSLSYSIGTSLRKGGMTPRLCRA